MKSSQTRPNIRRALDEVIKRSPNFTCLELIQELVKFGEASVPQEEKDIVGGLFAESDRGVALIAGEILNKGLGDLIESRFADHEAGLRKKIILRLMKGDGAPFSSFSRRINYCFAMGYFNETMFNDLELIREIRNQMAHTAKPRTLSAIDLSLKIDRISMGKESGELILWADEKKTISKARAHLIGALVHYSWLLRVAAGIQQP